MGGGSASVGRYYNGGLLFRPTIYLFKALSFVRMVNWRKNFNYDGQVGGGKTEISWFGLLFILFLVL